MSMDLTEARAGARIVRLPQRPTQAPASRRRAAEAHAAVVLGADPAEAADLLRGHGFAARPAGDPAEALRQAAGADLVVVDVDQPGPEEMDLCRRLAESAPVLVRSARAEVLDRIAALELGADDFVARDCHPLEFLARARALVRRAGRRPPAAEAAQKPGWRLEPRRRELSTPSGRQVSLTRTESLLLDALFAAPGHTLTAQELEQRLYAGPPRSRAVSAVVSRLRRRLAACGDETFVRCVRGRGYALDL